MFDYTLSFQHTLAKGGKKKGQLHKVLLIFCSAGVSPNLLKSERSRRGLP